MLYQQHLSLRFLTISLYPWLSWCRNLWSGLY